MKNKLLTQIILAFILFGLPSVGFFMMKKGRGELKHDIALLKESKGTVPPYSFIDQEGRMISDTMFDDKIVIANYFFTRCTGPCPKVAYELSLVQAEFRDEPRVVILSHTTDPEHDSVSVLKQYSFRVLADSEKWHFLTGDKEALYKQAIDGYKITAGEGSAKDDFVHSSKLVLIKNGTIRNYYEGTDHESVNKMVHHIIRLLQMKEKKK